MQSGKDRNDVMSYFIFQSPFPFCCLRCQCASTYVCLCLCVCMWVCQCVCLCLCMCVGQCVLCTCVSMWAHVCVCVYVCVCVSVYVHLCMNRTLCVNPYNLHESTTVLQYFAYENLCTFPNFKLIKVPCGCTLCNLIPPQLLQKLH